MNGNSLTATSSASPPMSLRETLASVLMGRINSPADDGETLKRAHRAYSTYYDPGFAPEMKADLLKQFVLTLKGIPAWAMHRAFDRWAREMARRPTPAEILAFARDEVEMLTREIARRDKESRDKDEYLKLQQRKRVTGQRSTEIASQHGFTPERAAILKARPMARSWDEADAAREKLETRHWSETADPDGSAMQQLRASRDKNELIRAARVTASKLATATGDPGKGQEGPDNAEANEPDLGQ